MPPTPQIETDVVDQELFSPEEIREPELDGDRIVISGISGLYPNSYNVPEFSDILYNQVNPLYPEGTRWSYEHVELSKYVGKIPDIENFDAQFFTVFYQLASFMDPQLRKMLEHTYQALYDAGLSPRHVNGQKIGVYIGSGFSDSDNVCAYDATSKMGLGILGGSKAMFANRISYWLNLKGPSQVINDSGSSTFCALELAYRAILRGDVDAAIVGGTFLNQLYQCNFHFRRFGVINTDGKTKSYSENADGTSISDTIGIIILQKSKDALRNYAELVHVKYQYISKTNETTGPEYGFYRDPQVLANFTKEFYNEANVSPHAVEYVEGCGLGVPAVDKSELEAIEEVYCKDRADTLLVGSVTSTIGYTQAATAIAGITKVLLGYYRGELAANLNCENPRKDIAALRDGRMRIVSKNEQFGRTYVAINGCSELGSNSLVLLRGHYKPKDLSRFKCSIPQLVLISGRQESSVKKIIDSLKSRPVDAEELALLRNIHSKIIPGHLGKGYILLDTEEGSHIETVKFHDEAVRPLWFVYSGMGSQWAGMGAQLMRIPIFAAAIARCEEVLKPKGLDIVHIITSTDKTTFDNILHSFVGIAAVQIGLTDILKELELKPDGIIGHSVGELGCAYADGCLTAEEMILAAYSRGLVSQETPMIRGSMAAVGLGYEQISSMCPPEIDIACHNSSNSCTISGPADAMREFVAELTAKSIFAKEVPSSNIAYHSRYIAEAGPVLLKYLKEVIKDPKPRSERWISTSVPEDKWTEESAKYCSAEYHTNNLLNPVLLEETLPHIPNNAVLVEVAPHGLLQAILKRALPPNVRHIPLTRRGHPNNAQFLLQAIGNMYLEGLTPIVQALYPKVQFPVSTETPMLSHLVEWVHDEKWKIVLYYGDKLNHTAICKFIKSIHDKEYSYLQGNVIQEKRCYPFSAALVSVWDMFAMHMNAPKRELSIELYDLFLYAQPLLFNQRPFELTVTLERGSGRFEVISEYSKVISGYIKIYDNGDTETFLKQLEEERTFTSEDIYQLLQDKDYNYSEEFCGIERANAGFDEAALVWNNNWVTLIDSMLQLNVLRQHHHGVSQPTHIRTISIDVEKHTKTDIVQLNGKSVIKAVVDGENNFTRCGGVFMEDIKFRNLPVDSKNLQLELFIPTSEDSNMKGTNGQNDIAATKLMLQSEQIGKLDSLRWVEDLNSEKPEANVTVHFAGLSVFDVKNATGFTSYYSDTYGMDYSGVTESGDRVMGIVESGAASTHIRALPELLWPVPNHWSLEDAATVPLTYAHAFYALVIKGRLLPGAKVLVHGGTGALGLAAIAISLAQDCEVFATVSDIRKKQFLRKLYPQIKDDHIGNSRDNSFADNLLTATHGEGCSMVVNCLKGGLKNFSIKCVAPAGVFIDVTQISDLENYEFGMCMLRYARTYMTTDFLSVFKLENQDVIKRLHRLVSEGIASGYVVPLPRVTYAMNEVTRAFSLLGASQHRGKVLLRIVDSTVQGQHRMTLDPTQYQVMFWNNNALGSRLAEKLINRGARQLYVKCSELTEYQRFKIRAWETLGVKVVVSTAESKENKSWSEELSDAISLGTVEGIFVIISKATNKDTKAILAQLDSLDSKSRLLCPKLRYFTVVSDDNALGKDVCLSREKSGLRATFLDLSSLSDAEIRKTSDVVEVAERAICSSRVVSQAKKKALQSVSLFEQLAEIGVKIPQNIDGQLTLQQLGVTEGRMQSIYQFLNINFNICMEENQLPLLTIEQLLELKSTMTELAPNHSKGLGTFINFVDPDELRAVSDLIMMPTLKTDEILTKIMSQVKGQYLCIIPGMEGHYKRFSLLCQRLKLPAFVLQPGLDYPRETPQETAKRYMKVMRSKLNVLDNFYILGYESGVAVALELAAILEDQGLQGTVFCVGGTPWEIHDEVKQQTSHLETREQLQDEVLCHKVSIMAGKVPEGLDDALKCDTWEEKVNACVRLLHDYMTYSKQYARDHMETALACFENSPWHTDRVLRSRLVLLRAALANIEDTAKLQQLSEQPVFVHQLQFPLAHVLQDLQCSAIINQYLDPETLDSFNKANLCQLVTIPELFGL